MKSASFKFIALLGLPALLGVLPEQACLATDKGGKTKTLQVWALEQQHDYMGPCKVYLCSEAMRVDYVRNGITIISRPPDWMVIAFSPIIKKYSVTKPQAVRGVFTFAMTMGTGRDVAGLPLSLQGHCTTSGIKAASYITTKKFEDEQMREFANHEIHPSSVRSAVYQVADSLKTPAQQNFIMARIYGCPVSEGIPLELTYKRVRAGQITYLSTKSCKKTSVPASNFNLPSGYSRVPSMGSLLAETNSGKGGIGLILHEMDKTKEFPLPTRD